MPDGASRILGLRTETDSVLSAIGPIGLAAAAARPALMVDLDPAGPRYPGDRSLAELVADGPSRSDLFPHLARGGAGVALLRNGGVVWDEAIRVVSTLATHWASIVLRVPGPGAAALPWPVIPLVPLLPGFLHPVFEHAAVWQSTAAGGLPPGPGPVLPPLDRRSLVSLLGLRTEPRGRWVRSWRRIWELPWP